jgi:hypothetical protein
MEDNSDATTIGTAVPPQYGNATTADLSLSRPKDYSVMTSNVPKNDTLLAQEAKHLSIGDIKLGDIENRLSSMDAVAVAVPLFVGDVVEGLSVVPMAESNVGGDEDDITTSSFSSKSRVAPELPTSSGHHVRVFEDDTASSDTSLDGAEQNKLAEAATVMSTTLSHPSDDDDDNDDSSQPDAIEVRSYAYNLLQRLSNESSKKSDRPIKSVPNGTASIDSNPTNETPRKPPLCSKKVSLAIITSIVLLVIGLIVAVALLVSNNNKTDASAVDNDNTPPPPSASGLSSADFFPPTVSPAPTTSFVAISTECQSLDGRPRTYQYQAEDAAALIGNATRHTNDDDENDSSGYCGKGYVTLKQAGDRYVLGYATLDTSGYYTLTVRYSTLHQNDDDNNDNSNAELLVSFDSTPLAFLEVNGTTNTHTWTVTATSNLLLKEGSHYLEVWIRKEYRQGIQIDWLALTRDVSLTKSQYVQQLLKQQQQQQGLNMELSGTWSQNASLAWMQEEDELDWSTVSSQELVERLVLADFYFATYGDVWTFHTGWLSARHVCDWYGIVCVASNDQGIKTTQLVTDLVLGTYTLDIILASTAVRVIFLKHIRDSCLSLTLMFLMHYRK